MTSRFTEMKPYLCGRFVRAVLRAWLLNGKEALAALVCVWAANLAIAADAPPTEAEQRRIAAMAAQAEAQCLSSLQAGAPSGSAKEPAARAAALAYQATPPSSVCSCVGLRWGAAPVELFRGSDRAAAVAYHRAATAGCFAETYRQNFYATCNWLRTEAMREDPRPLRPVEETKAKAMCACAAKEVKQMQDEQFKEFLLSTVSLGALSQDPAPLTPSRDNIFGIFATCGARTSDEIFGRTAP